MNKPTPSSDLPDFPEIGNGTYRHCKGNLYDVVGMCVHTESLEQLVLYSPLYNSKVKYWVRPYSMFTEKVTVDGREVPRFQKLNSEKP